MRYHYFVSYCYWEKSHTTSLVGMAELNTTSKIKSLKDVEKIASQIAKELNFEKVIILNYKLFRKKTS